MLSRKTRRKLRNWLAGFAGAKLIRIWCLTLRVRFSGGFHISGRVPVPVRNAIYVLWHHDLFTPAGVFVDSDFRCMISQHADGEMIAKIIERLGMKAVRGSTARGGPKVVREFLAEERGLHGLNFIITPDGPRGPRHDFQAGAIYLASRSGLPVVPSAVSLGKFWSLPSWDRFRLPRPFSRVVMRQGEAIHVPPDLDRDGIEEFRKLLEKKLQEFSQETYENFEELYSLALPASKLAPAVPGAERPVESS